MTAPVSRPCSHRRALALGAILCMFVPGAGLADAGQSAWVASTHSKVRLVSGTVQIDGKPAVLAGIQLRMDQGWKTYWRTPGDSGVPPSFDWSGSKNLKSAEVMLPAPHRFTDGGGTAIGYDQEIVFPVKLTPEREGEPVALKLVMDYGLCMDLCIPNEVTLELTLPADAAQHRGDALLLESALARVPVPAAPGKLPEVASVEAKPEKPGLLVEAHFAPNARETDLFIEAEGGTFVPVPVPLGPPVDGKQLFAVTFPMASDAEAIKNKALTLTLVSDLGSTETIWRSEQDTPSP